MDGPQASSVPHGVVRAVASEFASTKGLLQRAIEQFHTPAPGTKLTDAVTAHLALSDTMTRMTLRLPCWLHAYSKFTLIASKV